MTAYQNADVVIVGGGAAGLSAAVAAAEAGVKDIIVLESRKGLGGNGNFVLGCFAAESKIQLHYGIKCKKDDVFKMFMKYHHWKTNAKLVRDLIEKSSDTIEWLEGHGVEWIGVLSHFPGQEPKAHHHAGGAATTGTACMRALRKACDKLSVRIMTETRGLDLITGDGTVTGIKATSKGKEIEIRAKAVIVATGGLFGNEKMIQESITHPQVYEDRQFVSWGLRYKGDGVRMLTEAGAAREGRVMLETHAPVFAGELKISNYTPPLSHITMWVNNRGERFADEMAADCFSEGANAFMRQPDKLAYSLYDENIKDELMNRGYSEFEMACGALLSGGVPDDPYDTEWITKKHDEDFAIEEEKGFAKKADTLEEIAAYIGCDAEVLKATVGRYNEFCAKGHDDDFAKDRQNLRPLQKAPFYALQCRACVNTVHGDIKCNHHMNVLNKQDEPISGLFAAGVDTGGADWHTYDTELTGHSFGFSVSGGRIAGENAAKLALNE